MASPGRWRDDCTVEAVRSVIIGVLAAAAVVLIAVLVKGGDEQSPEQIPHSAAECEMAGGMWGPDPETNGHTCLTP